MKHIILILSLILCVAYDTIGQNEYTINKSSGKLKIMGIDELEVQGHDGNSIIFINNNEKDDDHSERARGLRIINSAGLNDNSGIGLSIEESSNEITVQQISNGASCNCDDGYTIKVPNSMGLYIVHSTTYGDDIMISNMKGEIEISVNYNDIMLDGVTGPLAVKTVYGDLETKFGTVSQSNAMSLVSVYGHVDVSMPANTRADLQVSTNYGALYSDMDIKVTTKGANGKMKSVSSKKVNGTINGGGVEINLSAMYDDVYLRSM